MNNDLKDFSHPDKRHPVSSGNARARKVRLRYILPFALVLIVLFSLSSSIFHTAHNFSPTLASPLPGADSLSGSQPQSLLDSLVADSFAAENREPEIRTTADKVREGDTFETILLRNGIDRETLFFLLEAARPAHNLNRVVTGHLFNLTFEDSLLVRLEYEIDEDRKLIVAPGDSSDWSADVEETVYQVAQRQVSGTIESSLYETVQRLCSSPELALALSELYAWQIDFHNDIRKGDSFKVLYEEKIHPRGTSKIGRIIAAEFVNAGKTLWGIRFANAEGKVDYFDLDGLSLRRKFLRSPFKYMPRISSRFSLRRFHPILKIYRPHLGVDYAAPTGTPVLSLGEGRVTYRGWKGGFGRFITIKHNGMYSTAYGHLSGYASSLKAGGHVNQGQVIGYVGSSGLATGPHLDFRFFKNNQPVNPLKIDIPAGDPVAKSSRQQYVAYRDSVVKQVEAIQAEEYGPPLAGATDIYGPPLAGSMQE